MRCKFCFATFKDVKRSILPKGHLAKADAIKVVSQLGEIGFEKITFAGGEPTLCPWLPDLIQAAKAASMTTMIVTNGSNLSNEFLEVNRAYLDWIAVSIDSLNPETNIQSGRAIAGSRPLSLAYYLQLTDRIKHYGYGLKINTVVNSKNFKEDISELIRHAIPSRWKIFQVLPIEGQNDQNIAAFKVSQEEFLGFIERHKGLDHLTKIIPESNEAMKGSYAMVDPAGRFYDNSRGKHHYSRPILEVGARSAIRDVDYDLNKFIERGGIYDWRMQKTNHHKITLSGCVGSGKTTIGRLLAERLKWNFTSIGNRTRAFAESKGMRIVEFQAHCLDHPELDKQLDAEFSGECNSADRLVIDYRLGFKFIADAYHIFLKISEATAEERLKAANRATESFKTVKERNDSFHKQFVNAYGVDYTEEKHYDLVVDVEKYPSPEAIVDFIFERLRLS